MQPGKSSRRVAFVYDELLARDIFRPDHPLKPARVRYLYELLVAYGVFDGVSRWVVSPQPATEEHILAVHSPDYVDIVRRYDREKRVPEHALARYGITRYGDTPPFEGMYDYALLVCGASLEAARLVVEKQAEVAFNAAGGVNHHAHRNYASGFGIFNDAAVAIAWLLQQGHRVAYVDIDVHHGDGVEAIFEDDNRVLTISLHESTRSLFPGPRGGFAENIGTGRGTGFAVNVPLAPATDDETWLWAFDQVVPPLLGAFKPDVLVTQLGVDTHFRDPLAHLQLTTHGFAAAVERLAALSPGRWVALGGGGYHVPTAVRAWALAYGSMAGILLPDEVPATYCARYPEIAYLHDREQPRLDPVLQRHVRAFAEQSVATVKRLVFPVHGLPS
jgi:acetoin utilization protein AcuC